MAGYAARTESEPPRRGEERPCGNPDCEHTTGGNAYCSVSCKLAAYRQRKRRALGSEEVTYACARPCCGRSFVVVEGGGRRPGSRQRYCRPTCRKMHQNELVRARRTGKAVPTPAPLPTTATWEGPRLAFPRGDYWEVCAENVARWNRHRFAQFLDLFAREFGANHELSGELLTLRQDICTFERLYWQWCDGWQPDRNTLPGLKQLLALQAADTNYAEGLALYLRDGRAHWGGADLK